jgi:hypothetical protein
VSKIKQIAPARLVHAKLPPGVCSQAIALDVYLNEQFADSWLPILVAYARLAAQWKRAGAAFFAQSLELSLHSEGRLIGGHA